MNQKVYLSKRELIFLELATRLYPHIYDLENYTNKQFRQRYKIQKADVEEAMDILNDKLTKALHYATEEQTNNS